VTERPRSAIVLRIFSPSGFTAVTLVLTVQHLTMDGSVVSRGSASVIRRTAGKPVWDLCPGY
jgi:hypothetical protein